MPNPPRVVLLYEPFLRDKFLVVNGEVIAFQESGEPFGRTSIDSMGLLLANALGVKLKPFAVPRSAFKLVTDDGCETVDESAGSIAAQAVAWLNTGAGR